MTTRPTPAELAAKQWSDATARWLVEAWKASGGPLSQFARELGVSADRVRWWVMRLAAEERGVKRRRRRRKRPTPPMFIPAVVPTQNAAGATERVIVRLPGGIEIEATSTAMLPPEWVATVARIVAGGA